MGGPSGSSLRAVPAQSSQKRCRQERTPYHLPSSTLGPRLQPQEWLQLGIMDPCGVGKAQKEVIATKGRRVVSLEGGEGLQNNCGSLGRGNVVIYTGDSYIYSCLFYIYIKLYIYDLWVFLCFFTKENISLKDIYINYCVFKLHSIFYLWAHTEKTEVKTCLGKIQIQIGGFSGGKETVMGLRASLLQLLKKGRSKTKMSQQ